MQVRKPAVSGIFYPANKESLLSSIKDCFMHEYGPRILPPLKEDNRFIALIVPHAAYTYSGPIAANCYYYASSLKPDLIILIGPNHYGIGSGIASMKGIWETPLGRVEVDNEAVDKVVEISKIVDIDIYAHSKDHCLEVQLPFLQFIYDSFKILPILLWMQDRRTAEDVGKALADIAKERNTLLIASSDFTHYESNEVAYKKDNELIKCIEELDLLRYYTVLERSNITACGYGAMASIIYASKLLGAEKGELVRYATSGDIAGNKDSVVGYASMIIS